MHPCLQVQRMPRHCVWQLYPQQGRESVIDMLRFVLPQPSRDGTVKRYVTIYPEPQQGCVLPI